VLLLECLEEDTGCGNQFRWLSPQQLADPSCWRIIRIFWVSKPLMFAVISVMRCSFCRMLSANCSGGQSESWTKRVPELNKI
jgi:hypothetical protein